MREAAPFIDGIHFGEGPRWHDGRLWFSDFYDHGVWAVDERAARERICEVPNQPSGLGWLPDGSLLVVSMIDRRVMRLEGGELVEHADISAHAPKLANDMVVSESGHAYVGNFGFDLDAFLEEHGPAGVLQPPGPPKTVLVRVDPSGDVEVAADEIDFPNGMVITPDGGTLVMAESMGFRLSAFDIGADGSLSNRRVWADLKESWCTPDGICLDAEGCIWVANAVGREAVRVAEGGEVLDKVTTPMNCYACMLGGEDRRTLYCMTAPTSTAVHASAARNGAIVAATVDVPGAGLP